MDILSFEVIAHYQSCAYHMVKKKDVHYVQKENASKISDG